MKKILVFWSIFWGVFLWSVWLWNYFSLAEDTMVLLLLAIYYLFQIYSITQWFKDNRMWLVSSIIVQSMFAIISPLYYSNFWDPMYEYATGAWLDPEDALYPCQLCWWARIMMFPIFPLMIFHVFSKSRSILWYIFLVSIPGMLLELFHYILQKPYIIWRTSIENPFWCTATNPCAAISVDYFNIFTIPFLCFLAFLFIFICTFILLFVKNK